MSRTRPTTRTERAACEGKVRHETRRLAVEALRVQLRWLDGKGKDREPMGVFHCPACGGGWHVGRMQVRRGGWRERKVEDTTEEPSE